jgi:hypothetical protein
MVLVGLFITRFSFGAAHQDDLSVPFDIAIIKLGSLCTEVNGTTLTPQIGINLIRRKSFNFYCMYR